MHTEITLVVRGVVASGYNEAKEKAFVELSSTLVRRRILHGVGVENLDDFKQKSRAAKEANGSFTVTLP